MLFYGNYALQHERKGKIPLGAISLIYYYLAVSAFGFCEILRTCLMRKGVSGQVKIMCLLAAARGRQDDAFKLLLSSEADSEEDIAMAYSLTVAVVRKLTQETLGWLLARSRNIRLTKSLVEEAAHKGDNVMKIVLDRFKESRITKEMLEATTSCGSSNAFEMLSARADVNNISEGLLQNAITGKEPRIVILPLDRFGHDSITEGIMRAAASGGCEETM